jgi:hypothetical protein
MGLFQDVTTDYAKHRHAVLRVERAELGRLHASGLAIADTETTGLKAGESGLLEPAVIRAMTIGEIKAYNREADTRGLPEDQRIPVPRGYADSEIRLISLQHFLLPNRPMIHDRDAGLKLPTGSYTSDLQQAYEYDTSAYALGVTHTELTREKGYGPIQGMKVNGAEVETLPSFVPLMESFLLFTGTSPVGPKQGVAYFNAPFDIPFLRELFVDAMAYQAAKNNEHRQHDLAVHRGIGVLDVDYSAESTTPAQRAKIVAHIKKRMLDSGVAQERLAEYFAPARWHCVLQAFRAAHPELGGHTLDALMNVAGLAEGDRGAHSAIEDVVLTARGMLHLLEKKTLGQDALPTMAELAGVILRHSHGDAAVSYADNNGRDVIIDFPKGERAHAEAVEHWVRSFNRAKPADPRTPELSPRGKRWFSEFREDENGFHIVASGAEKRPLFLSFIKHLGVASQLLDGRYPWLSALEANDKPGSWVDVTIGGEILADVPWNILRRNVAYLHEQPANQRSELLGFLRDIAKASDALGGVLLREENGRRYLRLYGHVRQHGTVDIPWPKEVPLAEARERVFKHLEEATRLGLVPHASRAQLSDSAEDAALDSALEEDTKRPDDVKPFTSTTFDFLKAGDAKAHIHREVTPAMFQLFKAAMPPSERGSNFSRTIIDTVKFGNHYSISVGKRGDYITLDGPPEAFDAYVARRKVDGSYEAIAEKPTNILTDAGWLLDRLQKIPGVGKDGVEVTARNRIIVHQPLGIGMDALALMHAAQIPYRAEEKELRFSAGALMQDAFTYSLAISRTLKNDAHHTLMGPASIIPSISKGLKDKTEKDENHKPLGHVKWEPLLGLQLHYKAHGVRPAEITRIPPDKMVERSLPIGRRRVQRIFARLAYLPKKLKSLDDEVRWEVTLTKLEQALFTHALAEVGAQVEWRRDAAGEACVVISENDLSKRGNPIALAMQTMSDQLATLTEATGVPEWYFSAHPELNGDKITLTLPEDRSALFKASAIPVYEGIQKFLQQMQKDAEGVSLDENLKRIMGDYGGNGGSAIKRFDNALRRDPDAKLGNILNTIEQEIPALFALHKHTRSLANAITPSTVAPEDDKNRRTLALNQLLMTDRRSLAQMIAACDAMAEKEPEHAERWMELRNKVTDTTDRVAVAIHEADRLREALGTGASTIANDGTQWRSSLIGAIVHARLDGLEKMYLEQVRTHTSSLVDDYCTQHAAILQQFGMRGGDDALDALLVTYCQHAAQRLAVLHAVERNPQHKQEIADAAMQALGDAYGFEPAASIDFLNLYATIADPSKHAEECKSAGKALMNSVAGFSAKDYWLPMCLFGKATKEDVVAAQRAELRPEVEKTIKSAYHAAGIAHLYLAAEMQAELDKANGTKSMRTIALKIAVAKHKKKMLECYEESGHDTKMAETQFRAQTRAALRNESNFFRMLDQKKAFLELQDNRATLSEYSQDQQEKILRAGIAEEGGRARLEEFLFARKIEEISLDADLQAISINDRTFEAAREQRNKAAVLNAKNRMVAELDDLGKIEYHARRDIEALGMFLQHEAVKLDPHLEAMPINSKQMDLPEFQGLKQNAIPYLRDGAETLDRHALQQAKEVFHPSVAVTTKEYHMRSIEHSLSALLGITPANAKDLLSTTDVPLPKTQSAETDYFLLDTSAVIGYFETLRHHVPRPHDLSERDFVRYHSQLLQRLEALARPEIHGYMPLRIPDYVFYELSGLMPPMLHQATKHFAAIDARYAPKLEKAQGTRLATLQQQKAKEYQGEIDNLVDWSIRLDRRRPLDEKSTIGDRVEELNQLFTLFAYYPNMVLPTHVGEHFFRSARIESSVVAGIGKLNQPANAGHYREEVERVQKAISVASDKEIPTELAHYTLSFNDLMQTPNLAFQTDHLRIHWGQMYFMGLIDEHQYRNFMRNMSGAKEANAQGHDNNSRFVTYGSLMNRTKETGLSGSGLVEAVKAASAQMEQEGAKPETIRRHNLTLGELKHCVPDLDVRHAIGPAKLTIDQAVFGGLLPGAAIKRHRVGEAHEISANDVEVETLRLIAQTLGYAPPAINYEEKDRYERLRNSLKHQGFFERTLTLEDCARIRHALAQTDIACTKLDLLIEHLPEQLSAKPKDMAQQKKSDGSVELTAPLERIFTQALVHGVLSSEQFVALLAKLDPSSLDLTRAPHASIKAGGLTLQFRLKPSAVDIRAVSADTLAASIVPKSCWLMIADQTAPHFDRRQRFDDLVAMGRSARRSGTNFSEGQVLLDRLLANQFRTDEGAAQKKLSAAHAAFTELFGTQKGDTLFFQLMKDFESRQERQFQTGDHVTSSRKPAECPIAANHRNRLIDRRNKGEASVVEAAHTLQREKPDAQLWVVGNDSDIVSREQCRWLDPEIERDKNHRQKLRDPVALGKQCETPGVRLRPPVAAQHSRLVTGRGEPLAGDERTQNAPTRNWLEHVGRLAGVAPMKDRDPNEFTHKYAKESKPFRERFGG